MVHLFTTAVQGIEGYLRPKPKRIYEYCLFRKTRIFAKAIIEPLKNITLLIRKRFQEVIVMPSHIVHQLFHFVGIVTAVLLGSYIAVP